MPPFSSVSKQTASCLQAWFWFIQWDSELQQTQFTMALEMYFLFLYGLIICFSHSYNEPPLLGCAANLLPTILESPKAFSAARWNPVASIPPTPHTSPELFLKEIQHNLVTKHIHHRKGFNWSLWAHIQVCSRTEILFLHLAFDLEPSCICKGGSVTFSADPWVTVQWQTVVLPHNALISVAWEYFRIV